MALREQEADPRAVLESVLYITQRLSQVTEPDLHGVLKIRYFADKLHLAKHGFQASGDRYVAMNFGPVASLTYDLLKVARGDHNQRRFEFLPVVAGNLTVDASKPHRVYARRSPILDYLSVSDREAIDEAVSRYGRMTFGARTLLSHDGAWKAAWNEAQSLGRKQSDMPLRSIAAELPNAEEVLQHLDDE